MKDNSDHNNNPFNQIIECEELAACIGGDQTQTNWAVGSVAGILAGGNPLGMAAGQKFGGYVGVLTGDPSFPQIVTTLGPGTYPLPEGTTLTIPNPNQPQQ